MDEAIQEELTPIMCLCAVFEVAKTAAMPAETHARVEACFNRAHKALEDAQKSGKKKTPAKKPRKR